MAILRFLRFHLLVAILLVVEFALAQSRSGSQLSSPLDLGSDYEDSPSDYSPAPKAGFPPSPTPAQYSQSPAQSPHSTHPPQSPHSTHPAHSPWSPSPAESPEEHSSPPAPIMDVPAPAPSPNSTSARSPSPEARDVSHNDITAGDEGEKPSGGGMTGGKKAGLVVGVLAAACVVGLGGLVYKKRQENIRRSRYSYAARDFL